MMRVAQGWVRVGEHNKAEKNVARGIRTERRIDSDARVIRLPALAIIFLAEEGALPLAMGARTNRVGVIAEIHRAADSGKIKSRLRAQHRAKNRNEVRRGRQNGIGGQR